MSIQMSIHRAKSYKKHKYIILNNFHLTKIEQQVETSFKIIYSPEIKRNEQDTRN